jgi:hypothetical protein
MAHMHASILKKKKWFEAQEAKETICSKEKETTIY